MKLPMAFQMIVAVLISYASANCLPSLTEVNRTTALCKEFSLVLECSTGGMGSTVFKGDLLNCAESNHEILLLHSRFNTSNGTRGTCNNGTILGYSLPFNTSSNCYISQLCIKTIQDADGEVIRCVHDTNMEREVGNYTITADAPSAPTQGNGKATTASTNTIHSNVTNSLSGGEVEAIIICCSVTLVGVMIIVIVLSICGFLFKKKRLHLPPVQTISSEHTSSTDKRQQTTFHSTQTDEVSGYTLCTMDYDRVVIITDDGEYSHLQHPTGQHAPGMRSRDLL